ncbi:MAG: hypothetical protein HQL32_08275 [Planctomycetes bacterium]|nr:hypothetical protein [Planctomycetota bacterium]
MNRWEKILNDLRDKKILSSKQRFWKSLALLRQGRTQEALTLIEEGDASFQQLSSNQILRAEIYIVIHRVKEAESLLEQTYAQASKDTQLLSSWLFTAKRIKKPSPSLASFLNRHEVPKKENTSPQLNSKEDWERFLSLKKYQESFEHHLNYLIWANQNDHTSLEEVSKLIISHCQPNSYELYQVFLILKERALWDYLIDDFFVLATKINPKPEKLWAYWLRICPIKHKNNLKIKMQGYLKRYPSISLEEYITS